MLFGLLRPELLGLTLLRRRTILLEVRPLRALGGNYLRAAL